MGNAGETEMQKLQRLISNTAAAVRCTREKADRLLQALAGFAEFEEEEGWRRAA